MIKKLLNRLIFILPLLVVTILYFVRAENISYRNMVDIMMLIFGLLAFSWLIFELKQSLKFYKKRKSVVESPVLIGPEQIDNSENYFNLRIINREKELQVFEKTAIKFYLNKEQEKFEIHGAFGNRKYSLNDIEYLLYEFSEMTLYTIPHNWGKMEWNCTFFIKLKQTDKLIKTLTMLSERDNLGEFTEHKEIDNKEFYYSKGLEIANILSSNMKVQFTVCNHNETKN